MVNKIKATTSDKVNGKLVKYQKGDCLSIPCSNGKYLAVLVSEKFNKYYDFTLLDFYSETKPKPEDFYEGKFFGTRFGSWDDLLYATERKMILCKFTDNCLEIEKVCRVELLPLLKSSYDYCNTINELENHYLSDIDTRREKTINAKKFPDIAFVSKHLVDMNFIILSESGLPLKVESRSE